MSENIFKTNINNKEIIIIGTAHVSKKSTQLVEDTIIKENPNTVAVEICPSRYKSIFEKDKWQNMDIIKVIKEKKVFLLLINIILSSFQKKIADKFGIKPGAEMLCAIKKSKEQGMRLALVDRDVNITLSRFWRSMGFFTKAKIFFEFIFSMGSSDEIKEDDIEKMKEQDALQIVLSKIEESYPSLSKTLIDERDIYLAQKIKNTEGKKIVAVVGAGHINGIKKYIKEDIDLKKLEEIPPVKKTATILKWSIPILILSIFIYGFFTGDKDNTKDMLKWWIIANSSLAGIGALIAFAHPITILSAVIAAPLTSLNPMIAAGWVSGLTEACIRKPKVKDFENIPQDITSIKGFWKNKITRTLLVTVLTNLGSAIGTLVALPLILKIVA